jgi:hypothetical protein
MFDSKKNSGNTGLLQQNLKTPLQQPGMPVYIYAVSIGLKQ